MGNSKVGVLVLNIRVSQEASGERYHWRVAGSLVLERGEILTQSSVILNQDPISLSPLSQATFGVISSWPKGSFRVFSNVLMEDPEQTFWPAQY